MTYKQPEVLEMAAELEEDGRWRHANLIRTQHAAIERKDALLRRAMQQMGKFSADDVCEAIHHKKADRHALLAPCPIAERFRAVWFAIKQELSQ